MQVTTELEGYKVGIKLVYKPSCYKRRKENGEKNEGKSNKVIYQALITPRLTIPGFALVISFLHDQPHTKILNEKLYK